MAEFTFSPYPPYYFIQRYRSLCHLADPILKYFGDCIRLGGGRAVVIITAGTYGVNLHCHPLRHELRHRVATESTHKKIPASNSFLGYFFRVTAMLKNM